MPNRACQIIDPARASLDALRAEIDRLDDSLLDLIERRLAMSSVIASLKRAQDPRRLKMRPRREAAVIARLTARAGRVPSPLIAQIWRGLMSFGLHAQVPTEIVLCAAGGGATLRTEAIARFGSAVVVRQVATASEALAAAADGEVVALIEEGLPFELDRQDELIIFETLRNADGPVAYAVGRVAPEDAMDDDTPPTRAAAGAIQGTAR